VVALFIGLFIHKEIKIKDIPSIFKSAALTTGTIMILVATATAFGRLLALERVPETIAGGILAISDNKIIVLLIINLFLLFFGSFMETFAAIIILTPVLLPIARTVGVDPLHFGIIMVYNLSIGLCTPPVGVNLFIAGKIGKLPMEKMFGWLIPAIGVLLVVLMLVTYIPALSLFLPGLLR